MSQKKDKATYKGLQLNHCSYIIAGINKIITVELPTDKLFYECYEHSEVKND